MRYVCAVILALLGAVSWAAGPPPGDGWQACAHGVLCEPEGVPGAVYQVAEYIRGDCGAAFEEPSLSITPEGQAYYAPTWDGVFAPRCSTDEWATWQPDLEAAAYYRVRYLSATPGGGGGGATGPSDAELTQASLVVWGLGIGLLAGVWGLKQVYASLMHGRHE